MTKKNLAFVFPGQGSQSLGMLGELAQQYPVVKDTFAEASEVFGLDMWQLVQDGPESKLGLTEITQPIMLVSGVACWRAWQQASAIVPAVMAGHSLGEYTAYVCADAMSLEEGVRLVKIRGELMRDAAPGGIGKMAAIIGLDDDDVRDVCAVAAESEVCQAVNFNAPGQVVIAGHAVAVDRAVGLAKDKGARKAMALPVSVPCHSDLMKPASEELAEALGKVQFSVPKVPVINNVDAKVETEPDNIRQKLVTQLYSPVLWVKTVRFMVEMGIDSAIECGPGKVLSGMSKRVHRGMRLVSLQDTASFDGALRLVAE